MNDDWSGLLNPGERILWQGQPDARIDWRRLRVMPAMLGAVFVCVGLGVAGSGLARLGSDGLHALVPAAMGLVFAAVGLRAAVGDVVIDGFRRSRTWYTLTDQRMLVATQKRGKRQLRDYTLAPETGVVFEDGTPGSVLISGRKNAGFRRIDDARAVYDLVRKVQRGQA